MLLEIIIAYGGLSQVLDLNMTPFPHDREQGPHSDHELQPPSCGL